jgi:hypothetical protein
MRSIALPPPAGRQASELHNPYSDPAGLGVRAIGSDTFSGELLEVLRLTADLGSPAEVEPLVRERCTKFPPDALSGLAPVARVERAFDGRLEIWSRRAEGFRLSAALEWAQERGTPPSLEAALTIGDGLLGALASLQALDNPAGPEAASGHGAIAIDQIVVSESGALTLTDYALGTTLAALQWPRERLWRRFRIAMPPAAGLARFDHRVDVTQTALVIASLLAGRVLRADEYPAGLPAIVSEAINRSCTDIDRDHRDRLYTWLRSAAELDSRGAFKSAALARAALREAMGARVDDAAAIGRWLRASRGMAEAGPEPRPAARPVPVTAEPVIDTTPVGPSIETAAASDERKPTGGRLWEWLSRS